MAKHNAQGRLIMGVRYGVGLGPTPTNIRVPPMTACIARVD
ncbi:MAG: hypothetical protein ABFD24_07740 [Anaerolineaceae bacterium]